jgi:hypothetical protein
MQDRRHGTPWVEQPIYIQFAFALDRVDMKREWTTILPIRQ